MNLKRCRGDALILWDIALEIESEWRALENEQNCKFKVCCLLRIAYTSWPLH